ncbi:pyridoxamine 5'-phosphate oxidase family protein [Candidatus Neptunochlamydia vexilliferae]|uniref:Pyridoxamine 5'-phosphate oxidase putative domain-containing protein n=1 Tax=Candidatus Neptunichlamydia vexilliferae TaxID=1651774 RepID=A0ABS0AZK6_9BACT|nr:pyridoxamine 5'-phosphate oxidase family protein [Candidatus Neptunochlamydia vexilliferae]MBF5059567.1 hypothetical protein [Candidatus Neptunochlamydia vexilliferae]
MKIIFLLLVSWTLFGKELHPITKVNQWCKKEKEWTEGQFLQKATLATVTAQGHPHVESVDIVHFDKKEGPLFFIGRDLSLHPHAALHLPLPRTHRTVSIKGTLHPIAMAEREKRWSQLPLYKKRLFLPEKASPKGALMPVTFIGYRVIPHTITFSENPPRSLPNQEVITLN